MTHYYGSMGAVDLSGDIVPLWGSAGRIGTNDTSDLGIFSPTVNSSGRGFFSRTRARNFDDVADGASNTIALFEVSQSAWRTGSGGNKVNSVRTGWAHGGKLDDDGFFPTSGDNLFSGISLKYPLNNFLGAGFFAVRQPVGSNHSGGIQIAMIDGSARFLNEGVDLAAIKAAACISEGFDESLE